MSSHVTNRSILRERCIFSVYIVTNLKTKKCYAGYTSYSVEHRWAAHIRDAFNKESCLLLHMAIRKYGPDHFRVQCIEEFFDEQDAKDAEIQLISDLELNRNRYPKGNGLNLTDGGDGSGGHKRSADAKRRSSLAHMRPVTQYTKEGGFVSSYESMAAALRAIGRDPTKPIVIRNVLEGFSKSAYGYMWTDRGAPAPIPTESMRNRSKRKPVNKYDLEGNLLDSYEYITQAAKDVGGHVCRVSSCCKGDRYTYRGFQWRYADDPAPTKYERISEKRQAVEQLTMKGMRIAIHASQKLAAEAVGGNQPGISSCVRGVTKSYKGYKWRCM